MDARDLLVDLDAEQRTAVTTSSTLVAVIAGAGSGKTRVLTRRVAYRVATGSADEAHTVVLTFTREAAGELRRRLPRLGLQGRCTAGTFHSVALGLLQQRWRDLDQRPWNVAADRRRLVRSALPRELLAGVDLESLLADMNWATARLLGGAAYLSAARRGERNSLVEPDRVAAVLDAYRTEKQRRQVVDLDDLLGRTIEAMEREPAFAEAVRWRFRHVLVDEAQDLNPLQHRLIDALRQGRDDLFLVGDAAQAIYGFNGADPTLLLDVATRFPGIDIVRLPTNHRSTPQVVETGAHVLRADGQPTGVHSARSDGAPTVVVGHDDEEREAAGVARAIARVDPSLIRTNRVAVLARTNAQLPPIAAALAAHGVDVRRRVHGEGAPIGPSLQHAYRLADPTALRHWAQDSLEGTDPDRPDDELPPDGEVARAVLTFLRSEPTGGGAAFRAWVDTTDPFGRSTSGVELLTFHGSKGREWHTVHLVGCETSLVPHRTATTGAAKAEEARLLYVAATRATDQLFVHWAGRRGGYQRKLTPLLDGFVSHAPEPMPAPAELVVPVRSQREERLERLRAWRDTTARAGGMLPQELCTDAALAAIADGVPATPDELDAFTGLGAITSRRLFDGIAAALATADQSRSTITGA